MKHTRLFKGQTAVVHLFVTALTLLFTYIMTAGAEEYRDPREPLVRRWNDECFGKPDENSQKCRDLADRAGIGKTEQNIQCTDFKKTYREAQKKYSSNCPGAKCLNSIIACAKNESSLGATADQIASTFNMGSCADLDNAYCAERNAGSSDTYTKDKDHFTERTKDLQQELSEKLEKSQSQYHDDQTKLIEFSRTAQDTERKMRDNQINLVEQMQEQMDKLSQEQKNAILSGQAEYNKMDMEYLRMRNEARAAELAIIEAESDLDTTCRMHAQKKYEEAKQARKELIARMGKKNLGSAAGAAGQTKREVKNLQLDYRNNFQQCRTGQVRVTSGSGGSDAFAKISTMKNKNKLTKESLIDQAAVVEKQRIQLIDNIQQLAQTADQKKNQLTQKLSQNLTNLRTDYQRIQEQNQQDYNMMTMRLQNQQQFTQSQTALINNQLMQANNELMLANVRLECANKSGGRMKDSTAERRFDNYNEATQALAELAQICEEAKGIGCDGFKDSKQANWNACNTYSENFTKINNIDDDDVGLGQ